MSGQATLREAESLLKRLAAISGLRPMGNWPSSGERASSPTAETCYRVLVEEIPAVIFMADLERGEGQAYVSPRIEETLGFSQEEWLEDPIRWYQQLHPEDKERWSVEAADLFLTGQPLRSLYRVLARDGHVVWFQCEARMMRHSDGCPWLIHGVAFDITDLKRTEEALQQERNVAAAILDSVGTLVIALDPQMRIVRFSRVCEQTTGYSFGDVRSRYLWDLISDPDQAQQFRTALEQLRAGHPVPEFESNWDNGGGQRLISWSITALRGPDEGIQYFIATGTDITARKRLEAALLAASEREQRRIGRDLHDGLGQLLTGIAFMSKAQEQRLAEKSLPEAADAAKIVKLVNEAIRTTRELSRGLMPISSEPAGLMTSLDQLARDVEGVFGVSCRFECNTSVLIPDASVASHLYYIAQEAVHNAIKHGQAQTIAILLSCRNARGSLVVKDYGHGFQRSSSSSSGMGLNIMAHRARMIGGSLEIASSGQGTAVNCQFPIA